jgi:hypothetical protein
VTTDTGSVLPRSTFILGAGVSLTAYGEPFSAKSLTGAMAHWCRLAGLPKGLTLHGLRKSLGVYLAEAEASTRQLMDVLGHDDIEHAELYSREASQVRLAVKGMDRVVRLVTRKPLLGEPLDKPKTFGGEPPYSPLIKWYWWARRDSNPQPDGYEPSALTIELQAPHGADGYSNSRLNASARFARNLRNLKAELFQ